MTAPIPTFQLEELFACVHGLDSSNFHRWARDRGVDIVELYWDVHDGRVQMSDVTEAVRENRPIERKEV